MTNREFDIYKLQTLIFSGVVAIALLVGGEGPLSTFTVPETLLGILGLSQVVYISGVLVRPASIKELDQALTDLRETEAKFQMVVNHNTDLDAEGNVPKPLPAAPAQPPDLETRKKNAVKAATIYAEKAAQVELMIESTVERNVDREMLKASIA